MEEKLTFEQVKCRLEAYYDRLMSMEEGDANTVEFMKMQTEIHLLRNHVQLLRYEVREWEHIKYYNLCKDLLGLLSQLKNSALSYYRAIKNIYREKYGDEVFFEVMCEAKRQLGRD